jgi:catechol 2,3-dioxygenase-like lactoylglutathione lyase family enzyme
MTKLFSVTLLVRDYDEAIRYFVETLGFALVEDTRLSDDKRWVVVAPSGEGSSLLLARAVGAKQLAQVGKQAGGRVAFFLNTDNFAGDYAAFVERGVLFEKTPWREDYGMVAVFNDLYGNRWDLIGPA